MNDSSYEQTLSYLFTRLPMFSRIGAAAYKADLNNTIHLCRALGDPQSKFRSIHIAGTNGKGSVSHMLASILQEAGYKTGLYTSPHLKDFRERIRIDGKMIGEKFVTEFTERIKPEIEAIDPSFFEITVAMAFDYFARESVDIAVIETGLGGRLDSTNVIIPEVSVITNIGWDHMNLLGDSLDKIAFEKGGIIKAAVPVVIGELIPETKMVFSGIAADRNAPMTIADERRHALEWKWEKHELVVQVSEEDKVDHRMFQLDLAGIYQVKNLLTVLEVVTQLQAKGWNISEQQIREGLRHTKKRTGLHGRWDVIAQRPEIVLDVAHNEAGLRELSEQLEMTGHHELHIVLGLVKDKDVERALAVLPKDAQYYFTQAHIPRAMDAGELRMMATALGLRGGAYDDVNMAIKEALSKADPRDLILVCGSVFLVGEVNVG